MRTLKLTVAALITVCLLAVTVQPAKADPQLAGFLTCAGSAAPCIIVLMTVGAMIHDTLYYGWDGLLPVNQTYKAYVDKLNASPTGPTWSQVHDAEIAKYYAPYRAKDPRLPWER